MPRTRFMLDVSAFIILRKPDGSILFLQRQPDEHFAESWSLPAGAIDGGETVLAAAVREAWEETGIKIEEEDLQLVHTIHCLTHGEEWMGLFFLVEKWKGSPFLKEPLKHVALEWHTLPEMPEGMRLYVRQALEMSSKGIPLSTYGWEG